MKILIADDDRISRRLLERTLVRLGHEVVQAKDGKYGVFVVSNSSAGEVARLHSVEIGAVNGSEITVVSGLEPGERIITTGANLLKDGQRVEVLQ